MSNAEDTPEANASKGKVDSEIRRGPFHDRITVAMRALGMNHLEEFADTFSIGRTTLYSLTAGRVSAKGTPVKPSVDTLVKLAAALEVPLHILVYELEPQAYGADAVTRAPASLLPLPCDIAGWTSAEPHPSATDTDLLWVEPTFGRGKDLRAFSIRGDAMDGGHTPIKHGDIVATDRSDKGGNNTSIVARLTDGRFICRLLKVDTQTKSLWLASANPEHLDGTPTVVPQEHVSEVIGRVVRILHDVPSTERRTRERIRDGTD